MVLRLTNEATGDWSPGTSTTKGILPTEYIGRDVMRPVKYIPPIHLGNAEDHLLYARGPDPHTASKSDFNVTQMSPQSVYPAPHPRSTEDYLLTRKSHGSAATYDAFAGIDMPTIQKDTTATIDAFAANVGIPSEYEAVDGEFQYRKPRPGWDPLQPTNPNSQPLHGQLLLSEYEAVDGEFQDHKPRPGWGPLQPANPNSQPLHGQLLLSGPSPKNETPPRQNPTPGTGSAFTVKRDADADCFADSTDRELVARGFRVIQISMEAVDTRMETFSVDRGLPEDQHSVVSTKQVPTVFRYEIPHRRRIMFLTQVQDLVLLYDLDILRNAHEDYLNPAYPMLIARGMSPEVLQRIGVLESFTKQEIESIKVQQKCASVTFMIKGHEEENLITEWILPMIVRAIQRNTPTQITSLVTAVGSRVPTFIKRMVSKGVDIAKYLLTNKVTVVCGVLIFLLLRMTWCFSYMPAGAMSSLLEWYGNNNIGGPAIKFLMNLLVSVGSCFGVPSVSLCVGSVLKTFASVGGFLFSSIAKVLNMIGMNPFNIITKGSNMSMEYFALEKGFDYSPTRQGDMVAMIRKLSWALHSSFGTPVIEESVSMSVPQAKLFLDGYLKQNIIPDRVRMAFNLFLLPVTGMYMVQILMSCLGGIMGMIEPLRGIRDNLIAWFHYARVAVQKLVDTVAGKFLVNFDTQEFLSRLAKSLVGLPTDMGGIVLLLQFAINEASRIFSCLLSGVSCCFGQYEQVAINMLRTMSGSHKMSYIDWLKVSVYGG